MAVPEPATKHTAEVVFKISEVLNADLGEHFGSEKEFVDFLYKK